MADTLAAVAIDFPGDDARAVSTRYAAVATLRHAGLGRTGNTRDRGTPYDGAAERLMRIVASAQTIGTRAAALSGLTELPAFGRLIPFLRNLAVSNDRLAHRAIIHLAESTGPEGLAAARSLYESGKVIDPNAVETLSYYAKANKWPCRPGNNNCG